VSHGVFSTHGHAIDRSRTCPLDRIDSVSIHGTA
jgi:hypothetical protein